MPTPETIIAELESIASLLAGGLDSDGELMPAAFEPDGEYSEPGSLRRYPIERALRQLGRIWRASANLTEEQLDETRDAFRNCIVAALKLRSSVPIDQDMPTEAVALTLDALSEELHDFWQGGGWGHRTRHETGRGGCWHYYERVAFDPNREEVARNKLPRLECCWGCGDLTSPSYPAERWTAFRSDVRRKFGTEAEDLVRDWILNATKAYAEHKFRQAVRRFEEHDFAAVENLCVEALKLMPGFSGFADQMDLDCIKHTAKGSRYQSQTGEQLLQRSEALQKGQRIVGPLARFHPLASQTLLLRGKQRLHLSNTVLKWLYAIEAVNCFRVAKALGYKQPIEPLEVLAHFSGALDLEWAYAKLPSTSAAALLDTGVPKEVIAGIFTASAKEVAEAGHPREALKILEKGLQVCPDHPEAVALRQTLQPVTRTAKPNAPTPKPSSITTSRPSVFEED